MDHQFDESYPFVYIGHVCLVDTKQKKPTPLDWGPPLHVNRV